jgi:hypothetical protein
MCGCLFLCNNPIPGTFKATTGAKQAIMHQPLLGNDYKQRPLLGNPRQGTLAKVDELWGDVFCAVRPKAIYWVVSWIAQYAGI